MNVLALSFQARFRCERSGACCTSGWPIPIEADRLAALREPIAAGRLTFESDGAESQSPFLEPSGLPPGAGAVLRTRASGACAFYRREGSLCAIQCALGHDSLPSACQHFPRRCLIEPDRIAVGLSHYCPTVARLTFAENLAPEIVTAPGSLVGHVALEGLDAREALPPLLKPGLLMDLEGYRAWERAVIAMLGSPGTPEMALASVAGFTERLRAWTPRDGGLVAAIERCRPAPVGAKRREAAAFAWTASARVDLYEDVRAAVPAGIVTARAPGPADDIDTRWVAAAWPGFAGPLRRFLAAHAFGNWCAYHGMGLRTVVRSLEAALAVVRVEAGRLCAAAERQLDEPLVVDAMRAADLLLVHLADPKALAARLATAAPGRRRA